MSTYGGDSWVSEAQVRKRRVEELTLEGIPANEAKKLANGKFVCLVCRKHPVVDTAAMLIVHRSGAQHIKAADDWEEENFKLRQMADKQIAQSLSHNNRQRNDGSQNPLSCSMAPLLVDTKKKMMTALSKKDRDPVSTNQMGDAKERGEVSSLFSRSSNGRFGLNQSEELSKVASKIEERQKEIEKSAEAVPRPYVSKRARAMQSANSNTSDKKDESSSVLLAIDPDKDAFPAGDVFFHEKEKIGRRPVLVFQADMETDAPHVKSNVKRTSEGEGQRRGRDKNIAKDRISDQADAQSKQLRKAMLELRERKEKELSLRQAGWIRDGFDKWFREANVEFDSDEEAPAD